MSLVYVHASKEKDTDECQKAVYLLVPILHHLVTVFHHRLRCLIPCLRLFFLRICVRDELLREGSTKASNGRDDGH